MQSLYQYLINPNIPTPVLIFPPPNSTLYKCRRYFIFCKAYSLVLIFMFTHLSHFIKKFKMFLLEINIFFVAGLAFFLLSFSVASVAQDNSHYLIKMNRKNVKEHEHGKHQTKTF